MLHQPNALLLVGAQLPLINGVGFGNVDDVK
jgi:hypothetical protein